MFIMTVHTSVFLSGLKDVNMEVSCCAGLYAGVLMNFPSFSQSLIERIW